MSFSRPWKSYRNTIWGVWIKYLPNRFKDFIVANVGAAIALHHQQRTEKPSIIEALRDPIQIGRQYRLDIGVDRCGTAPFEFTDLAQYLAAGRYKPAFPDLPRDLSSTFFVVALSAS